MTPDVQPTHLDLFSGIGGFALAARRAGFRTIGFCEIEPYARAVLGRHWPGVPAYPDVRKLCRRVYDCEYDEESGEAFCPRCLTEFGECDCIGTDQFTDENGFPDLITSGTPCQPASLVGKRRGDSDERWLWPDTIRVIGELQPRFALMENPRAILSLDGGSAFRGILGELADFGYDVLWDVIPASALGAGHRRERVWILAAHSDRAGLERHAGNGKAGRDQEASGHAAESYLSSRRIDSPKWYHQSGIQPVVDGIPGWLAKDQLAAVGNAIVPQVAFTILAAINPKP